MGQKQGFLNLLKSFVINFYWIYYIMKTYSIWCVPAQIRFLRLLFLRYGPKWFPANQIAGFFNQPYFHNKSLKIWSTKVWLGMAGNRCDQSGHWTLKLTVYHEWINGMNWFVPCQCSLGKLKLVPVIFGWTNGINWFLRCWYRFTKIENWSIFFRWAWSKMGVAYLVMGL